MILTQFFYTLTFLATLVSAVGVLIFFLCCTPDEDRFVQLTFALGCTLVSAGKNFHSFSNFKKFTMSSILPETSFSGISAALATLIFGFWANRDNWMPGHDNNFFGWSFGVAIVSVFALLASGTLFWTESEIQKKKKKYMRESQSRLEMDQETKA